MNKDVKKILLYCISKTDYYYYQLSSLKKELEKFKYDIQILFANENKKYQLLNSNYFDVIIDINGTRNNFCLNSKTKYISWIQDVFSSDEFKNLLKMKNSDYVLSLGDLKNLGIDFPINCKKGYLYSGAYISKNNSNLKKYDLNIVGFIPPFMKTEMSTLNIKKIFSIFQKLFRKNYFLSLIRFFINKKVTNIIDQNYKALEGQLNINKLQKKIYLKYFFFTKINTLYLYINNIIRDYPRFLDRIELIEKLNMCKYKIIVAGKNWENYIDSKKKNIELLGEINSNKVLDIYRQSKVTISSNCHGLGLHSRVLEAGISKSLVMMNKSDPNISGNMSCEFKPGIHFIEYSKESFSKKLQMILNDNKLREQITNNMFEEIKSKHLWSHRAKQLDSIIKNDFF